MGLNRSILKSKWPLILWALFIFGLHILPSEHIPKPPDWNLSFDKIVHFVLFAVLSFLLLNFIDQHGKRHNQTILIVVLFSIIYGFLMESVQIIVPGRQFHMLDLLADSIGAIAGLFAYFLMGKLQKP